MVKREVILSLTLVFCLSLCFTNEAHARKSRLVEWWERLTEDGSPESSEQQRDIDPEDVREQSREKDFDREERIEIIRRRLEAYPSIVERIENLLLNDETGQVQYKTDSGERIELEEVEEEDLRSLFAQVNQHATRLNVERINRQLRQMQLQGHSRRLPPRRPEQPPENVRPPAKVPSVPRRR